MRDINRIDKFCNEFAEVWKTRFPDWRFGQIMSNFQLWHYEKYGDIFFPEERTMMRRFKEFAGYKD